MGTLDAVNKRIQPKSQWNHCSCLAISQTMVFPQNLIWHKADKKVKKVSRGDLRKHVKSACMKKQHMGKSTICNSTERRKHSDEF